MDTIRRVETPQDKRVESGPIVFDHCGLMGKGYDWPGVFLRGDLCGHLQQQLKKVAQHYRDTSPGAGSGINFDTYLIDALIKYINDARV